MKYFRKDFRFWALGLSLSLFSLVYIKLDSGALKPQYFADSANSLLDKTEQGESFKIADADLVKRVSKAIFQILLREE